MHDALTILVTSASKKTSFIRAVKHAVHRIKSSSVVIAGDISDKAVTRFVADQFWAMPPVVDASLDGILRGCSERDVDVIFPTRDGELLFWARHAEDFERAGIHIVVSPAESILRCVDKLSFASFGESLGFPVIKTEKKLQDLCGTYFVVKERTGAGSRGIGLRLSADEAERHARQLEEPVFQVFVEGREISVDAWVDHDGRVKGCVLRQRDSIVDGESQITTTFRDQALEQLFSSFIAALDLRGPVVLQAIIEPRGDVHIVECNARFGGASTVSLEVGLDSVYWSLMEASGGSVEHLLFHRAPGDITQIRMPQDVHVPRIDI